MLVLAACFGLAACVLAPALAGYQRYVITSGSMSGAYDRGSLMYAREVPTSSLRVGDVITYRPPAATGDRGLVTHRISWIGQDDRGARAFRTRGDANASADPWQFTLARPTQARAVFRIPYVGYVLAVLADRRARMLLIGLPALLIACGVLARTWRQAGEELRRRQAAAVSTPS